MIQVQFDVLTYLIHICNSRCLVPDTDGKLIWCATNYWKSEENTNRVLIDLPGILSKLCIECLGKSGLAAPIRNESNEVVSFKKELWLFSSKKIPPWKYGNDKFSPCERRTFTACRSMQNMQCLSGSEGSCKYCCKYVGKVEKNYRTFSTYADGSLIWCEFFFHNNKPVTSNKV